MAPWRMGAVSIQVCPPALLVLCGEGLPVLFAVAEHRDPTLGTERGSVGTHQLQLKQPLQPGVGWEWGALATCVALAFLGKAVSFPEPDGWDGGGHLWPLFLRVSVLRGKEGSPRLNTV